jgi:hypothetical protein
MALQPSSPRIGAGAPTRRVAGPLVAGLAVAAIVGAGLFGYWQHRPLLAAASGHADSAGRPVVEAEAGGQTRDGMSAPGSPTAATRRSAPRPAAPASASVAAQWPLWESQLRQPIPPREPPLTPPSWRLVGATAVGGSWKVIILRQGKATPEFYGTGDTLPGGYVVGPITEEDVTLIQGKRAILLSYIGT